jgi:hypothetical protein
VTDNRFSNESDEREPARHAFAAQGLASTIGRLCVALGFVSVLIGIGLLQSSHQFYSSYQYHSHWETLWGRSLLLVGIVTLATGAVLEAWQQWGVRSAGSDTSTRAPPRRRRSGQPSPASCPKRT